MGVTFLPSTQEDKVVEELHRKLGMAKSDVDLAQAKKEELWEKCAAVCPHPRLAWRSCSMPGRTQAACCGS